MYLIIRIFPVSPENSGTFSGTFFSVWKILCPLWALWEGKNGNKLSPIAVGNVIQWERAETHREASGSSPIDLNGSWTTSHKASETSVGRKVYCKTERWEWRNAWVSKLCGSSRVSAKTCWSECKVNGQADFVWLISVCLCLEERVVSSLAATARKSLFIMQVIAAAFLLSYAFCSWYMGFYTKLWWGLGLLVAWGHPGLAVVGSLSPRGGLWGCAHADVPLALETAAKSGGMFIEGQIFSGFEIWLRKCSVLEKCLLRIRDKELLEGCRKELKTSSASAA